MKKTAQIFAVGCSLAAFVSHAGAQSCGQWVVEGEGGVAGPTGGMSGTDGRILAMVAWDPDGDGPERELAILTGQFRLAGSVAVETSPGSGWGGAAWDGLHWRAFSVPAGLNVLGTFHGRLIGAVNNSAGTSGQLMAYGTEGCSVLGNVVAGSISRIAEFDGQPAIGGSFAVPNGIGGSTVANVARLVAGRWALFDTGLAGGSVNALVVHGNELIAAGSFVVSGQRDVLRVARWSSAAGQWQQMGSGSSSIVVSMASSGSELFVGGEAFGGGAFVMRWNGQDWASAVGQPRQLSGFPHVRLFAHGGVMYASGPFITPPTDIQGYHNHVRWWDGSGWVSTGENDQYDDSGGLFAVWRGDEIVTAPMHESATPPSAQKVRCYDGATWRPAGAGFDRYVRMLSDLGNGQIMASGGFTAVGDTLIATGVALWNGSQWQDMSAGLPIPDGDGPDIIGATSVNGAPVLTGQFHFIVNGVSRRALFTSWNGAAWAPLFTPGVDYGYSSGIGKFQGSMVATCDIVDTGVPGSRLGIRTFDGTSWGQIPATIVTATGPITLSYQLTEFEGSLILSGPATSVSGVAVNHVASWNGAQWTNRGAGLPTTPFNSHLIVHEGQLYLATKQRAYRLDGQSWTALPLFPATIDTLGTFVSHGGTLWIASHTGLLRWTGAAWVAHTDALFSDIWTTLSTPQGLLIGGPIFTAYDGRGLANLVRWSPEPELPSAAPSSSFFAQQRGRAAQLFWNVRGTGPLTIASVQHNGVDVPASSTHVTASLTAGSASLEIAPMTVADTGSYAFVLSNDCGAATSIPAHLFCLADFDQDGQSTLVDVFAFLRAWMSCSPRADANGDHVVDASDLFARINAWMSGC